MLRLADDVRVSFTRRNPTLIIFRSRLGLALVASYARIHSIGISI
jgi:hypothetical protein